jgi:putative oxidoreductase
MSSMKKPVVITSWVLQVIVAAIFVMALIPKLTGDEGSKALFEVLGVEPMGRLAAGVFELIAVVLILVPKTAAVGGVLSLGIMSGAILSHLTKLGVSIDAAALGQPALEPINGPSMFIMAIAVFLASLGVAVIRRSQLPIIGSKDTGVSV